MLLYTEFFLILSHDAIIVLLVQWTIQVNEITLKYKADWHTQTTTKYVWYEEKCPGIEDTKQINMITE